MLLAISEAIAVQQVGLLPLGQPFQTIVQLSLIHISLFYAKKSVRPAGLTDFQLINDVAALYA